MTKNRISLAFCDKKMYNKTIIKLVCSIFLFDYSHVCRHKFRFYLFIDCCRGENLSENLNRLTVVTFKIKIYDSKFNFRVYFGMFHLGCYSERCGKSLVLCIGDCSDRFGWRFPRMAHRPLVHRCHCRSGILHILLDFRQIQHFYEVVVLPRIIKPKKKKDRCFPSRKQRFFFVFDNGGG